jgi:uncharacterized protein (DUF1800 family)
MSTPSSAPAVALKTRPALPDAVQIALCRFGLGARPDDLQQVSKDPRGYVLRQLAKPKLALLSDPALPTTDVIFRQQRADEEMVRRARDATAQAQAAAAAPSASSAMMAGNSSMMMAAPAMPPPPAASGPSKPADAAKKPRSFQDTMFETEVSARFARWATTDTPFLERLVAFWMNHFTVSAGKNGFATAATGAFEREAIRPNILGKFETMVLAVEQHPVMLIYLDNQASTGPNSRAGNNGARGLNENLAREALELHTLGVNGGYTQADVTAFARILTGWIYTDPYNDDLYGGRFTFAPNRHEPGDVTVLGKTYPENGKEQGEAALRDFARHPSTARHIAAKLARAFVSDTPPASLVARLETAFLKSGGDLAIVSRALVEAPESWALPPEKLRSPDEFVAASLRAIDVPPDAPPLVGVLNVLGAPFWRAPGPNGYPIESAAWLAPESMMMRLDVSLQLAHRARTKLEPDALAASVLGANFSPETKQAMGRAESREQALAVLLMAPEFQRR